MGAEGRELEPLQPSEAGRKQTELTAALSVAPCEIRLEAQVRHEIAAALGRDEGSIDVRCVRCGTVDLELHVAELSCRDAVERCTWEGVLKRSIDAAGLTELRRSGSSDSMFTLNRSERSAGSDATVSFRGWCVKTPSDCASADASFKFWHVAFGSLMCRFERRC